MRRWINIALLLAVAVVATLIFVLRDGDRLEPAALTDRVPEDVTAFRIDYPEDGRPDVAVERRADGWQVTRPIERIARGPRVVRVLSFIDDRVESCYAVSDDRLEQFGLDGDTLDLVADGTRIGFGDRSPDGRRYVRAGDRLCLVDDVAYPLLSGGVNALAATALITGERAPVHIHTPEARAVRGDDGWAFEAGQGSGARWANRWRAVHAERFELDPPDADHGEIRVELEDGSTLRWRIARHDPGEQGGLLLVPADGDYGMFIRGSQQAGLVTPPESVEDTLN